MEIDSKQKQSKCILDYNSLIIICVIDNIDSGQININITINPSINSVSIPEKNNNFQKFL